MTLGDKIKDTRKQSGLTQEQLAETMTLSRSAIAKWESGTGLPDVDSLILLAQLLNVSIDDLLDDREAMAEHLISESDPQITEEETMSETKQSDFSQDTTCRPQQSCSPGYIQGPPLQGYAYPSQNLPALPRQRIRPNGKHYFSARTIVYPIVFLVVHFLIQLLICVFVVIFHLDSFPFSFFIDMSPEMIPEMIQELWQTIIIPTLLYSSPLQIITYVLFLWYQKRKNRQYLLVRPAYVTAFPLGLATAFGGLGITTLIIKLFEMLAKNSPVWQSILGDYQRSAMGLQGVDLLLMTLCIAVLVPIAEELLFRGIITEEIRRVAPDWLAIFLGGIIFALVHGNLIQILYVLPLGLLLSASYIWTNSIWVPVMIHVVFNFFGSVFEILIGENKTVHTVYTIFLIVMIPVGIFCIFIMNRMFKKNKKGVAEKVSEK
ncbi:MAG: type II CAAX prenyl endopeptidase Rce1 family protein [Saccharofermentanales bacterium]|jgi:membrane protease YdiL (CAAX protease family)/transcriptional regulator with XRE-family HTH domain